MYALSEGVEKKRGRAMKLIMRVGKIIETIEKERSIFDFFIVVIEVMVEERDYQSC